MELGRRVSAGMDRRRAPLFAAAYQAASTSQASSTIPVSSLPLRSLRSGEIATIWGRSAHTCSPAGVRAFSTFRRPNRGDRNRKSYFQFYMIQMYQHFKAIIAQNHSKQMHKIERNQADLSLDLHRSFHDKIWKWFGAVSAVCSASISGSYFLNDHRMKTSEENVSKQMEGQDREIKLIWLQLDKQMESLTCQNEVLFYTVRVDQVTKGGHVVINDSPGRVHCTEQHADDNGEMIRLVCNDIFTGRPLELLLPNNYLIKVPYVSVEEYLLVRTNSDGLYVTVLREETDEKKDIRVPPATIERLSALKGKKAFVMVTSVLGKEVITSVREVYEDPSLWAWASGFFRRE